MELNIEQVKQALKACPERKCGECPMPEGQGCAIKLYKQVLRVVEKQETEYNELYELCESYRRELGEVKTDTVLNITNQKIKG